MSKQRIKMFSDKSFNQSLIKLTLPIALQSLMLATVAAADAVMLGNIEQNAMSAVSLATQIQFVQNMVLMAFTSGITILAAQYWGKGDKKTVSDIFCIGLRCCGIVSVLFFAGCVFFPQYLMLLFTNENVLVNIGVKYLKIAGWSYLMTGISQCYLCVLKVSDRVSKAATISTVTVIINIILNAVFIYGLFGAPKMEERGAALATLIARTIELIWSIGLSLKKGYIRPSLKGLFTRKALLSKDFTKCVVPLMGSCLMWSIGFTTYSAFMGHLGLDAAAANSVAAVVRDLVCCMCNGLASGGGILVGNSLGRGDLEKGKIQGIRLAKISFLCGGISTVIMLAVTPGLLSVVKMTEKATEYLLQMMIVMSVYMIGRAVNTIVINGVFSAGGDPMFDAYSLAVTMWCIAVPLAALGTFVFNWPPIVVYAMTCLDEVGKIPWVMIHFKKYKWVKDLTREMK